MTLGEQLKLNISNRRDKILEIIIRTVETEITNNSCKVQVQLDTSDLELFDQNCSQRKRLIEWCHDEKLVLGKYAYGFSFTPGRFIYTKDELTS